MITLTQGQQEAMAAFQTFLCDPNESVFVLSGYSGTGKSTLVKTLLDNLSAYMKTVKLINPSAKQLLTELTATTHKAAENFGYITGHSVSTIHSFLNLRVNTDYSTGETKLVQHTKATKDNYLLFIDEASYIDSGLLSWIFKIMKDSKIVFIGDPAQLTPVKYTSAPVFAANFSGAQLTEVVRTGDNPILDLSTKFRGTVNTGEFFQFTPDGQYIKYCDRDTFNKEVFSEFTRQGWQYHDSKLLGWTNKCVIGYNHVIRDACTGNPQLQVGDYAICNNYVSNKRGSIKTDQTVLITRITEDEVHGVKGNYVTLDYKHEFFFPNSLAEAKARLAVARSKDEHYAAREITDSWIDLRAAYAQTVNKSQGSTYKKVFIDLDDISRCNSGDTLARMMYVAVSRASDQVILTGDIV